MLKDFFHDRRRPEEDMFLSSDSRSLRRGKRVAPRTRVCRPCLVMPVVDQEHEVPGVVLDMNPYGMLVRLLEPFEKGEDVIVQLMRDEDYTETFSRPLTCRIVRHAGKQGALTDVGLKIIQEPVRRSESRPPAVSQPRPRLQSARTRMHTIDLTVNERLRRRGR